MATEMKKLEDLLREKTITLPNYLVVKHEQDGYHSLPRGNEVYKVVADKINRLDLNEDGTALEEKEPVVQYDSAGNRLFYIPNTFRNPYIGREAVEVPLIEGDNKDRAMLDLFTEFVLGRNAFGVTIFATDVLAEVTVAEPPAEG